MGKEKAGDRFETFWCSKWNKIDGTKITGNATKVLEIKVHSQTWARKATIVTIFTGLVTEFFLKASENELWHECNTKFVRIWNLL